MSVTTVADLPSDEECTADGLHPKVPPTLRDSAFLYIARNVLDFPPTALASLPTHIRTYMFQCLPAMSICKLEASPACADICMDLQVWRVLLQSRLDSTPVIVLAPLIELVHMKLSSDWLAVVPCIDILPDSSKEMVNSLTRAREEVYEANSTYKMLYILIVSACVLAKKAVTKKYVVPALFHSSALITSHVNLEAFSDIELLRILVEECNCRPSYIFFSNNNFVNSSLWEQKEETFPLLSVFLSRIQRLRILVEAARPEVYTCPAIRFILEAVFLEREGHEGHVPLTHLRIEVHEYFIVGIFAHLADFLSAEARPVANFASRSLVSGHSTLTFFMLRAHGTCSLVMLSEIHVNLLSILKNQHNLVSLRLNGWHYDRTPWGSNKPVCPEYGELMLYLGQLFKKPQFRELNLKMSLFHSTGDPTPVFARLVYDFLSSPVEEQVFRLSAKLADLGECGELCKQFGNNVCVVPSSKHLHLYSVQYWMNDFIEYSLKAFPYQSLAALTLEDSDLADEMIAMLAADKDINLQCLHILKNELLFYVQYQSVTGLFAFPQLTTLTLYNVMNYDNDRGRIPLRPSALPEFIEMITIGLRKQAPIAKITHLNLARNSLGRESTFGLLPMFEALFSLPQLSSLTLDLERNCFSAEQIDSLCSSWETGAGGRRLLELRILQQDMSRTVEYTARLQKVAVTVL